MKDLHLFVVFEPSQHAKEPVIRVLRRDCHILSQVHSFLPVTCALIRKTELRMIIDHIDLS